MDIWSIILTKIMALATAEVFKRTLKPDELLACIRASVSNTASQYSCYQALDATLAIWVQENLEVLGRISRGYPPKRDENLIQGLLDAGFDPRQGADTDDAWSVLKEFFRHFETAILQSPLSQEYSFRVLHEQIKELKGLIPVSTEQSVGSDDEMPEAFKSVRRLLDQGKIEAASSTLDAILADQGESPDAGHRYFFHSLKGWVLVHRREFQVALGQFREGARILPERAAAHANVGLALFTLRQYPEALGSLDTALEKDPECHHAMMIKAQVLFHQQGVDVACEYVRSSSLTTELKEYVEGFVCQAGGEWDRAIACLESAARTFPDRHDVLLAICFSTVGLLAECIEDSDDAPWVVIWSKRESLYAGISAADRAIRLLGNAQITEDAAAALSYRAFFKVRARRDSEAAEDISQAVACFPKDPATLYRIAVVEYTLGRTDEAAKHLDEASRRGGRQDPAIRDFTDAIAKSSETRRGLRSAEQPQSEGLAVPEKKWEKGLDHAITAFRERDWERAAGLLREVMTPFAPAEFVRRYLNALFRYGAYQEAMRFIEICREADVHSRELTDVEISIHEARGALDDAIAAIDKTVSFSGESAELIVRRRWLEYRRSPRRALDGDLPSISEILALNIEDVARATRVLSHMRREAEACELAFGALQRHFDEEEAHENYIALFHFFGDNLEHLLNVDDCGQGVVVSFKRDDGTSGEILLDSDDGLSAIESAPPDSERYRRFEGRRVGERVILSSSELSEVTAEIVEIKNKFVWMFQDCMAKFQERFPGSSTILRVRADPVDPTFFRDLLSKDSEWRERIGERYRSHGVPISTIAALRGLPDMEVFASIVGGELGGMVACDGNPARVMEEVGILSGSPALCVDLTSLFVLHSLGRLDLLCSVASQLLVSRLATDQIRQMLIERGAARKHGFATLALRGDRLVAENVSPQTVAAALHMYEEILLWIEENTDIVPVPLEASEKLQRIQSLVSSPTYGSLAAAWQQRAVLLSEDYYLRGLASVELGVEGTWSLPVLLAARQENMGDIDIEECQLTLLHSHYRILPISASLLVYAFRKDSGKAGPNLEVVLRHLSNPRVLFRSVCSVVSLSLQEIWLGEWMPLQKSAFLDACLDSVAQRGDWSSDGKTFERAIAARFRLLPLQHREISSGIRTWEASRIL
ncbi:MAG TPA: tetratricopeptide repeat protein [Acidobacteriota bacterium]|nr:tetratricopeptide repeat protein [Acidobacteriota bacterium]